MFKPDVVTVGKLILPHMHSHPLSHTTGGLAVKMNQGIGEKKSVGRTTQGIITATTNNNACEASV